MTPGSFDYNTSKEALGDARVRKIEQQAREDAAKGVYRETIAYSRDLTYWDRVTAAFEQVVYATAYKRRLDRLERMKTEGSR